MRRAGTIIRSPLESRNKDKNTGPDGDMRASEVLSLILEQIAPLIYQEDEFLTDFLQINDAALTYADYMNLDNYFRRQAARTVGLSSATMKLVRGALDLIFGFLAAEFKTWLDMALAKDSM
jgi:exocyst complex component 1